MRAEHHAPACRHCGASLNVILADLGVSPIANDLIEPDRCGAAEPFYPLEVRVCGACRLAQTSHKLEAQAIFRADYAYYSSHSSTWLDHAAAYVRDMAARFDLTADSRVVELACNDGYLLQFVKAQGIPCLGVEPTRGPAEAAREKGLDVEIAFFGEAFGAELAARGWRADLIAANNVLAHVPDINDFVAGAVVLLKDEGVATFEVQHLLRLMQRRQFDTIYHEHFSYLSLLAAERIFAAAGLRIFDVEELATHGGSVRFFVCKQDASHANGTALDRMRAEEREYGLDRDDVYRAWRHEVMETKLSLIEMCISLKKKGARIAAYGAPAKGATLLNYCGLGRDFIDFTVDKAPSKQGRMLPGVRIPIFAPEKIDQEKPDFILILPWNIKDEIKRQLAGVKAWGGRFIIPIPQAAIET